MSIEKEKIKAVIFDMDGVLINTEPLYIEATNMLLKQHGSDYQFTTDDWKKLTGDSMSYRTMIKELIPSIFDLETWAVELHTIVKEKIDNIELMPGVKRLLEFLKQRNIQMGVASNTKKFAVDRYLNHVGLREYFSFVLGGDQIQNRKPNPEIYTKSVGISGYLPEECLIFEDTSAGLTAALKAGTICIIVPTEFSREHDFTGSLLIAENIDTPEVLALF